MKPDKKKPRIRNRPRNKANRLKVVESENNEAAAELQNKTSEQEDSIKNQDLNLPVTDESEDDMPELEDEAIENASTNQVMPENVDVIRTIQRLMREKLLKNQENVTKPETEAAKEKSKEPEAAEVTTLPEQIKETEAAAEATPLSEKIKEPLLEKVKEAEAPKVTALPEKSRKEAKMHATTSNQKSVKSKEKPAENNTEKSAFIQNLQKKMEAMMADGDENLPNTLMENLHKLFDQGPISDIESDGDDEEYVEYIYKPRKYFMVGLCNLCKCDLCKITQLIECPNCHMTYYCSAEHQQNDAEHRQLCAALQQVAASTSCDGHIFNKCSEMSADQFRSYRIITIRNVEMILQRSLTATEQEVILFPRICMNGKCREFKFNALKDCVQCGVVAFCLQHSEHMETDHEKWCKSYQLFKEFIIFQEKFGKLEPSLPTKILKEVPLNCNSTKQIFNKLGFGDLKDNCEFAALTQISTAPLTAWYALKLCDQLMQYEDLTIHLIGAEIEFEVDVLHKWELFFLHITPKVKNLNVVFVGPELNPNNISLEQFQRTKCCIACRKSNRTVKYFFESQIYHDYCQSKTFLKPNLVCFFNAGLYRSTGYNMEDTWPETIHAASNLHVPIVVTAYTEYETPLDMLRFEEESGRQLKVIQKPSENPFASVKPERNFISDDEVPLMFKNYFCFVVQ